jgi:hypothetical protein
VFGAMLLADFALPRNTILEARPETILLDSEELLE